MRFCPPGQTEHMLIAMALHFASMPGRVGSPNGSTSMQSELNRRTHWNCAVRLAEWLDFE